MTQDEYHGAAAFMEGLGVRCPPPAMLQRAGIIGSVRVTEIISKPGLSKWCMPPYQRWRGLVLADPEACSFVACSGQLGYFAWERYRRDGAPEPPKPWMLTTKQPEERAIDPAAAETDMFDDGVQG